MTFMNHYFTTFQLIMTSLVLITIVIVAVAVAMERRQRRTLALRTRFGTEYDRAVSKHGSAKIAEERLADRETRVDAFTIRELGVTEHDRFVCEWQTVQSRFVDHPKAAVTEADDLVNALLKARGYPQSNFEQRADDLSVTYPTVMKNYRLAHAVASRLGRSEASTEELRNAMIQYRGIFDELAGPQSLSLRKAAA
ncbi:MAG: hypothetical protein ABR907_07595 [Terracidiphilus sp.]|jgi:hypothetical protein